MTLSEGIDKIQGDQSMVISFIRRRPDLEAVVAFVWALKDGGYAGFASVGNIERLKPPRLDKDALIAALIREGYRDDLENADIQVDTRRSIADLEYTYRHKEFPPLNAANFSHGNG